MPAWPIATASLRAYGFVPPKEAFPKAKEAALKALEIDDTLAEAHTSLAYIKAIYDWDWSGAEKEFQRAIELNPSYADAHQLYGLDFDDRWDGLKKPSRRTNEPWNLIHSRSSLIGIWEYVFYYGTAV